MVKSGLKAVTGERNELEAGQSGKNMGHCGLRMGQSVWPESQLKQIGLGESLRHLTLSGIEISQSGFLVGKLVYRWVMGKIGGWSKSVPIE